MALGSLREIGRLWHHRGEVLWIAGGQVIAFLGGFVAIKLLTTIMGPEGYGYFALGLAIAGAVQMFVFGPLSQSVTRFVSVSTETAAQSDYLAFAVHVYARSGLAILVLSCLAGAVVAATVGPGWGALVGVASVFAIASGWNGAIVQFLNTLRLRRSVALHQGADVWIRALAASAGAYVSQWFGVAALTGYLVGAVFICVSLLHTGRNSEFVRQHWNHGMAWRQAGADMRRQFSRYAGSFVLGAIPSAVNMFADRWILQALVGSREVGIYAALYQIANAPVALLVSIVNQVSIPIIYERAGNMTTADQRLASRALLNRVVLFVASAVALICGAAYLVSEWAVRLLTTHEFVPYHGLLVPLVAAIGISWIGNLKTIEAECHKVPHVALLPKFMAAGVFLVLGITMGRSDGARGVALALMITAIVYTMLVIVVLRMTVRKSG